MHSEASHWRLKGLKPVNVGDWFWEFPEIRGNAEDNTNTRDTKP
jgi:hypothetical protein